MEGSAGLRYSAALAPPFAWKGWALACNFEADAGGRIPPLKAPAGFELDALGALGAWFGGGGASPRP